MPVLDRIVTAKREAVRQRATTRPLAQLQRELRPSGRSLRQAIRQSACAFILECKHASPSGGVLRTDYDPVEIARQYTDVATAISVLADEPFFRGSLDDVRAVSAAVTCPVLCKDIVVDPYQVYEARAYGADAILLMLSVLSVEEVRTCLQAARSLGMEALVEVRDEPELAQALDAGAELVGINNRDLQTLEVSLEATERLAPHVPAEVTLIAESGIRGHGDVRRLRPWVDGFLVGSSLMRRQDVAHACRELAYGRIKICGLMRPQDAHDAWRAGAGWGGMIFAPRSPRVLALANAPSLRAAAPLHWVGVFVDADPAQVASTVEALDLAAVQLHGDEPAEQVRELRERLPADCEIWKGHRLRDRIPDRAQTGADRLLLDGYDPEQHGGTGRCCDWRLVAAHAERAEVILAGGLRAENIAKADALGVWGLDVSSGVEEAPGRKSAAKLAALFSAVRRGVRPRSGGAET